MPFTCRFCGLKVFWNTSSPSPKTGRPQLCNARDPDHALHICSVKNKLRNDALKEETAVANFLASVRPETAKALLQQQQEEEVLF